MDDFKLAMFISLVFTGLFGMIIGLVLGFMWKARETKNLRAELSRRNQDDLSEQTGAAHAG